MENPTPRGDLEARVGLPAGLLIAAALVAALVARYPDRIVTAGVVSIAVLAATAGFVAWRFSRPTDQTRWLARRAGVALGVIWVIEIGFNNVVPPEISTGGARSIVDNLLWALISFATVIVGGLAVRHTGRLVDGVRAGFWCGLVSGLIACLAGLLLIVFGMNLLVRDPLMLAEFAARGVESGSADLATYVAHETLAGSLGHLYFIGIAFGIVAGAIGALVGRLGTTRRRVGVGRPR